MVAFFLSLSLSISLSLCVCVSTTRQQCRIDCRFTSNRCHSLLKSTMANGLRRMRFTRTHTRRHSTMYAVFAWMKYSNHDERNKKIMWNNCLWHFSWLKYFFLHRTYWGLPGWVVLSCSISIPLFRIFGALCLVLFFSSFFDVSLLFLWFWKTNSEQSVERGAWIEVMYFFIYNFVLFNVCLAFMYFVFNRAAHSFIDFFYLILLRCFFSSSSCFCVFGNIWRKRQIDSDFIFTNMIGRRMAKEKKQRRHEKITHK